MARYLHVTSKQKEKAKRCVFTYLNWLSISTILLEPSGGYSFHRVLLSFKGSTKGPNHKLTFIMKIHARKSLRLRHLKIW